MRIMSSNQIVLILLTSITLLACKNNSVAESPAKISPSSEDNRNKVAQWEYIVAKFFDGQLTGVSFLSENHKKGGYPQNAPSKFSSIYPKIKPLARVESEGWELRVLQKVFDELGRDGWELVCPIEAGVFGKEMAFIFKRNLQEIKGKRLSQSEGIIYDLDDPIEKKLFELNKRRKRDSEMISRSLRAFKPSAGSLTIDEDDIIIEKEILDDENSRSEFENEDPDSRAYFTLICSLDFDTLLKEGTYRKSDLKRMVKLSIEDISRFKKENPASKLSVRFVLKSSFLSDEMLRGVEDLRFVVSDEGKLDAVKDLLEYDNEIPIVRDRFDACSEFVKYLFLENR
jgi:hypothetical protein